MYNKTETTEVILALDTASAKTGYAVYKDGYIIDSGTWTLKRSIRFADLARQINLTIKEYGVTQIVAENVFKDKDAQKSSAFKILLKCQGVVECVAQSHKLEETVFIQAVAVKQYMWHYNTYSNLTRDQQKARMIKCVQHLGYELEHDKADDEADAIGLLITYIDTKGYTIHHPADKQK
ncbi:MAG: hypothetical protein LBL78_01970 [Prevotellaceae bacterium]|jgi:Holliday junction resolvasome RuvABC endonuclease subunit|nr:hypothetical protein [Prevotellaceae bacterium]